MDWGEGEGGVEGRIAEWRLLNLPSFSKILLTLCHIVLQTYHLLIYLSILDWEMFAICKCFSVFELVFSSTGNFFQVKSVCKVFLAG
jgi:hypothetical protein